MYIGYVIAGIGGLLLLLNGMAARHDDPKANQQAGLIALVLIVFGLIIQGVFFGFEPK
jgi:hypothetical protein